MANLWQQVKIITSFDDLTGVNVRFWAKLLDMHVQYTMYKIIACIEHATVLPAGITRVMREYKAGEGLPSYLQLIIWCLAPPLKVSFYKKPQNSELQGFLLQAFS